MKLVEQARQAREKASAPYSGYRVGAACLGDNGKVYHGGNRQVRYRWRRACAYCSDSRRRATCHTLWYLSPIYARVLTPKGDNGKSWWQD